MIVLPTRRRLESRRDKLYLRLEAVIRHASPQEVEHVMRQIHCINLRLRTYFIRQNETEQTFED